jgi:uncharacterized protein YndB with AHSA1/START domain
MADPRGSMTEGIRVTRVFDAPRELVWREWTEPEAFADWFGGPEYEVPSRWTSGRTASCG